MCIRHISHWQPCHHQRCTGIDICSYAEAHPGLNPSDCPKGENVFRDEANEGTCKICRERDSERQRRDGERRDGERRGHSTERYNSRGASMERHGHSKERHDERDESLDSVSTVDSDSTVRDEHHRERDLGDSNEGSKGDGPKSKDKKDDKDKDQWDELLALGLMSLAHAAS